MLTPRRGAMVWPGTSSACDLGTISWRMNAVCEPLDHDSCQPSEDQWRKRNKDLGCFKPMGEKQDNQLSWGTHNSRRSDRPLEERRPISGGEYNFEEHKYHRTPDDGRKLYTYAWQRVISKKFPHIDTGVLPDCASTSDLPQDTRGKHTGVIRTTSMPRN